jgi:rod shape-determining protein MreC
MKRTTYLFITIFILCQLSLSPKVADRLRSISVATFSPSTHLLSQIKGGVLYVTTVWPFGGYRTSPEVQKELMTLQLENHELRHQVALLKAENEIGGVEAAIGEVIFREPSSWTSSLWINLGKKTNRVVAKNSPVVVGSALVGVVEYVGANRSRVRLITDGALTCGVRAVRKQGQNRLDIATGEIQGAPAALLRSRAALLRCVGFYEEGAVMQKGDLLITTGMDGVFPEGLSVAEVAAVHPVTEGAFSYEVEAMPCAGNLNDLKFLMVLASLGIDEDS